MYLASAAQKRPQINAAIEQVISELAPDVKYIRYEVGQDWSGDWAIFFRVMLSDDAGTFEEVGRISEHIMRRLPEMVDFDAIGVFPYFNFRTVSEQATLQEPAWA